MHRNGSSSSWVAGGLQSHQFEQEGEAHNEGEGRQEILPPPNHEAASGQVLPCGS